MIMIKNIVSVIKLRLVEETVINQLEAISGKRWNLETN